MKIVLNKPTITRDDLEGVLDSLINDQLSPGASVKQFESSVSGLVGLKYSLSANSSVSAYHLVYRALQVDSNSEVIIPSYFNQAPLSALTLCGGKPVLVDCDKDSLFPSPEAIAEKVTENTKCIVTGHTFGYHSDTEPLIKLDIPLIEDISHAIGTEFNDNPVGSNSSFSILSFSPSMIITTGNGGMVLTNNSKHYSTMKDFRGLNDHTINMDCIMTDFQGAMGLSQFSKLKKLLERRREIASIYCNSMRHSTHRTPYPYSENFAYQSFPIMFDSLTEKIERYWKKSGIGIFRPINYPLHRLLDWDRKKFPNAERMAKKLYALPLYPTLTKKEIEKISKSLAAFI
jgi:dTDP-4-amino-4,6-dideoxygalactose transaminase